MMIKKAERIVLIITKRLSGDITGDEQLELDSWLKGSAENQQLFDQLCSNQSVEDYMEEFNCVDADSGWQKIASGMGNGGGLRKIPHWLYAAAIVAFVALATCTFLQRDTWHAGRFRQNDVVADQGLQFKQANVMTVLNKIAAKYNIEIQIPSSVDKHSELTGNMTEMKDIQTVLKVLGYLYDDLHIEYDGHKIVVKPS